MTRHVLCQGETDAVIRAKKRDTQKRSAVRQRALSLYYVAWRLETLCCQMTARAEEVIYSQLVADKFVADGERPPWEICCARARSLKIGPHPRGVHGPNDNTPLVVSFHMRGYTARC